MAKEGAWSLLKEEIKTLIMSFQQERFGKTNEALSEDLAGYIAETLSKKVAISKYEKRPKKHFKIEASLPGYLYKNSLKSVLKSRRPIC